MTSDLKTVERLFVWTALGEREIQLCFGDITALPQSEKVDFIMVSAFLGDYSPMRGTVIGALKHNIGLDVRHLAKRKVEDLRQQFNCWISRSLPAEHPYRQLICFERAKRDEELTDAVKDVFRALMPALNNQNKSVITPILASGHQHADETEMLKTMVYTAAKWMWLGMPLQTLKIVIYCNTYNPGTYAEGLLKVFTAVKEKIEKHRRMPKEPDIILDIFFIYSEKDTEAIETFVKYLKKHRKKLSVKTIKDVTMKESSWQHDLSEIMMTVARVIPVLSSKFLGEGTCIDQFNVAICCNRLTKRHLLAPVLMERLTLPIYMNMVQWVNCRSKTDDEFDEAANTIVSQIQVANHPVVTQYDVFISYAHKNMDVAKQLLEGLEKLDPRPKIFFDYQELTTGISWQQKLYSSIESSKCVLALISPDYLVSPVCQEELNLSLTKHFNKEKDLELVPIYISDTEDKSLNKFLKPIKLDKDKTLSEICTAVGDWFSSGKTPDIFSPVPAPLTVEQDSSAIRQNTFTRFYKNQNEQITIVQNRSDLTKPETSNSSCDIYISHSVRDQKYATFLVEYMRKKKPELKVLSKLNVSAHEGSLIDSAQCLVVLLSPSYINSAKEVEEFNVILSRERSFKEGRLLYVVRTAELTMGPTYFSLVPCDTSLCDDFWWQYSQEHVSAWEKHEDIVNRVKTQLGSGLMHGEICPLLKVACDILAVVMYGRYLDSIQHNDVILHNILTVHLHASELALNGTREDSVLDSGQVASDQAVLDQLDKLEVVAGDPEDPGDNDERAPEEGSAIDDEGQEVPEKLENDKHPTENEQNPTENDKHGEETEKLNMNQTLQTHVVVTKCIENPENEAKSESPEENTKESEKVEKTDNTDKSNSDPEGKKSENGHNPSESSVKKKNVAKEGGDSGGRKKSKSCYIL